MSSYVGRIAACLGLSLVVGISTAQAQVVGPVEFTTTFPFTVGHALLPAGSYTMTPDERDPMVFEVTAPHVAVFVEAQAASTASGERPSTTEVVFKHHGEGYVLANVWIEGVSTGIELAGSDPGRDNVKPASASSEPGVTAVRKRKAPRE